MVDMFVDIVPNCNLTVYYKWMNIFLIKTKTSGYFSKLIDHLDFDLSKVDSDTT